MALFFLGMGIFFTNTANADVVETQDFNSLTAGNTISSHSLPCETGSATVSADQTTNSIINGSYVLDLANEISGDSECDKALAEDVVFSFDVLTTDPVNTQGHIRISDGTTEYEVCRAGIHQSGSDIRFLGSDGGTVVIEATDGVADTWYNIKITLDWDTKTCIYHTGSHQFSYSAGNAGETWSYVSRVQIDAGASYTDNVLVEDTNESGGYFYSPRSGTGTLTYYEVTSVVSTTATTDFGIRYYNGTNLYEKMEVRLFDVDTGTLVIPTSQAIDEVFDEVEQFTGVDLVTDTRYRVEARLINETDTTATDWSVVGFMDIGNSPYTQTGSDNTFCSIGESVASCFTGFIMYLIKPQPDSFTQYDEFIEKAEVTVPFAYLVEIKTAFTGHEVSADTDLSIVLDDTENAWGINATFFTTQWITDINGWTTIRNLMGMAVWLALPLYLMSVINRLRAHMLS